MWQERAYRGLRRRDYWRQIARSNRFRYRERRLHDGTGEYRMTRLGKILEGQIFQTLFALIGVYLFIDLVGEHANIGRIVLIFAVLSSLVHQLWVAFFWRVQLHSDLFRGAETAVFAAYRIGFVVLSLFRIAFIIQLSYLDRGSLVLASTLKIGIAAILFALSVYGMYSVIRYFGLNRAFGSDHFFPEVRSQGLVRSGVFRFTSNGMYSVTVLFIYIVPVLFQSEVGLGIALFHHVHLWIHYFCTERIDLDTIYGHVK